MFKADPNSEYGQFPKSCSPCIINYTTRRQALGRPAGVQLVKQATLDLRIMRSSCTLGVEPPLKKKIVGTAQITLGKFLINK